MITSNIATVIDTISMDLIYFSNKFIESGFITSAAASDTLSKQGINDREKTRQLLNLVTTNYEIALDKAEWTDKFISIFFSQVAYRDLATTLTNEICPPGI